MFSRSVCFALLGCNRRKREKVLWTGVRIYSGNLNGLSQVIWIGSRKQLPNRLES